MAKKPEQRKEEPDTTLEGEIDRKIGDLVPQGARNEVVRRVTSVLVAEYFSGPIAHPRHLSEYEKIEPGAADRIITMAEKASAHRIETEKKQVESDIADRRLGMMLGAGAFALLIIVTLICVILKAPVGVIVAFLGTTVLGAIGSFINGRSK